MKIRQAEFAVVPTWVLRHPDLLGKPSVVTYAFLRMVAWERPDEAWGSLRTIAKVIADEFGVGEEAVRKHLGALQRAGVIEVDDETLRIPSDDPSPVPGQTVLVGTDLPRVGKTLPGPGQDRTQTPLIQEDKRVDTRESGFETFWERYPRKVSKEAARKVWMKMSAPDRERALAAIPVHRAMWARKYPSGDKQFIPHPSTWLNKRRWEDEIEHVSSGRETGLHVVEVDGQRIVGSAWS